MRVDNLLLEKYLGEGQFGEVYLTKKDGDDKIYATKAYEREKIEGSQYMKYLKNEINILKMLNHPNIVKFADIKKSKKHFYIIMEYCNGGELSKILQRYQEKYDKPFSQEIVQYLMRQIIDAFKYMHEKDIMHRDIKLENILLNFENDKDKEELNLMKAQVKIIDFGFACKLDNKAVTYTTIGNPLNMDPQMLKKYTNPDEKSKQLGYDKKTDIWALGSICYEMLIGKPAFDSEDISELTSKVQEGKYKVPTTLSREAISFLDGMLQYDSFERLTCEELSNHPFLKNDVKDFHLIDAKQVSNNPDNNQNEIILDSKNKSVWTLFDNEDETEVNNTPSQIPNSEVKENEEMKNRQDIQNMKTNINEELPLRNANNSQSARVNNTNINTNLQTNVNMGAPNPVYQSNIYNSDSNNSNNINSNNNNSNSNNNNPNNSNNSNKSLNINSSNSNKNSNINSNNNNYNNNNSNNYNKQNSNNYNNNNNYNSNNNNFNCNQFNNSNFFNNNSNYNNNYNNNNFNNYNNSNDFNNNSNSNNFNNGNMNTNMNRPYLSQSAKGFQGSLPNQQSMPNPQVPIYGSVFEQNRQRIPQSLDNELGYSFSGGIYSGK